MTRGTVVELVLSQRAQLQIHRSVHQAVQAGVVRIIFLTAILVRSASRDALQKQRLLIDVILIRFSALR